MGDDDDDLIRRGDALSLYDPKNVFSQAQRKRIAAVPAATPALDEAAMRTRAAWVAFNACLVPPDGGNPSEEERLVCDEACRRIEALPLTFTSAERQAEALALPEIKAMREALRNIAEGNLGPSPWQADYEKIRTVARAALRAVEGK